MKLKIKTKDNKILAILEIKATMTEEMAVYIAKKIIDIFIEYEESNTVIQ